MNDEMRAVIEWLNSKDGRLWSKKHHRQSPYAVKLFSLKEDDEELRIENEFQSWGCVDWDGNYQQPEWAQTWVHGV